MAGILSEKITFYQRAEGCRVSRNVSCSVQLFSPSVSLKPNCIFIAPYVVFFLQLGLDPVYACIL